MHQKRTSHQGSILKYKNASNTRSLNLSKKLKSSYIQRFIFKMKDSRIKVCLIQLKRKCHLSNRMMMYNRGRMSKRKAEII